MRFRKHLLLMLMLAVVVFGSTLASAAEQPPATKLETFLSSKGTMLAKDYYDMGVVFASYGDKITLTALVIYQPGRENERLKGMSVEITTSGTYSKSNTAFLDMEEIKSVSDSLAYISSAAEQWKAAPREYSELVFITKGDFKIGFYQDGTKQVPFASCGNIGKVSCFFKSMDELKNLKEMFDKALNLLKEK